MYGGTGYNEGQIFQVKIADGLTRMGDFLGHYSFVFAIRLS